MVEKAVAAPVGVARAAAARAAVEKAAAGEEEGWRGGAAKMAATLVEAAVAAVKEAVETVMATPGAAMEEAASGPAALEVALVGMDLVEGGGGEEGAWVAIVGVEVAAEEREANKVAEKPEAALVMAESLAGLRGAVMAEMARLGVCMVALRVAVKVIVGVVVRGSETAAEGELVEGTKAMAKREAWMGGASVVAVVRAAAAVAVEMVVGALDYHPGSTLPRCIVRIHRHSRVQCRCQSYESQQDSPCCCNRRSSDP